MAAKRPTSIGRKLASTGAVLVAIVAVTGAWLSWTATRPSRGTFCTLAGSIGTPVADTPEAAFDAWWTERHPGEPQADADIDRDGTTWHVDKGEETWIKVEVDRADHWASAGDDSAGDHDKWAVTGANHCGYA
ncbi:hypothetical protein ACE2AJ_03525 [Aquihabitans daechungensis]|uniref:hypothetical protein n=1 Tax=Aquihabitans daechungensis TaxID=1052257 RepID=UPI003B9F77E4